MPNAEREGVSDQDSWDAHGYRLQRLESTLSRVKALCKERQMLILDATTFISGLTSMTGPPNGLLP